MNEPIKQHYVPKTYLKEFSDEKGFLYIYNKETHKIFKSNYENFGIEKNIYTLHIPKNTYYLHNKKTENLIFDKYCIEKYLANNLECNFNYFKKNIENKNLNLDEDTKEKLFEFIISQLYRTPLYKKIFEENYLDYPMTLYNTIQLYKYNENKPQIYIQMSNSLLNYISSDNPVTLLINSDESNKNKESIKSFYLYPFSSKILFSLIYLKSNEKNDYSITKFNKFTDINMINTINLYIAMKAYKFFYSNNKTQIINICKELHYPIINDI